MTEAEAKDMVNPGSVLAAIVLLVAVVLLLGNTTSAGAGWSALMVMSCLLMVTSSLLQLVDVAARLRFPMDRPISRYAITPADKLSIRWRSAWTLLAILSLLMCVGSMLLVARESRNAQAASVELQTRFKVQQKASFAAGDAAIAADAAVGACLEEQLRNPTDENRERSQTLLATAQRLTAEYGKAVAEESKLAAQLAAPLKRGYWRYVVWPAALLPMMWLLHWRWLRRKIVWRLEREICVHCGYDLRATPDQCPECGTSVPRAKAKSLSVERDA